jgi:hypothetical protein
VKEDQRVLEELDRNITLVEQEINRLRDIGDKDRTPAHEGGAAPGQEP